MIRGFIREIEACRLPVQRPGARSCRLPERDRGADRPLCWQYGAKGISPLAPRRAASMGTAAPQTVRRRTAYRAMNGCCSGAHLLARPLVGERLLLRRRGAGAFALGARQAVAITALIFPALRDRVRLGGRGGRGSPLATQRRAAGCVGCAGRAALIRGGLSAVGRPAGAEALRARPDDAGPRLRCGSSSTPCTAGLQLNKRVLIAACCSPPDFRPAERCAVAAPAPAR